MRHALMRLFASSSLPSEDAADPPARPRGFLRAGMFWLRWLMLRLVLVLTGSVAIYAFVNPPLTWTMVGERKTHPLAAREWVPFDDIAPVMARSVVAAEDANFCLHWGFDMSEIRKVMASGSSRGASTLT
ncbi:MAG: transglycosylase domain-containing protein, partial [Paracoccaceae bacterium]